MVVRSGHPSAQFHLALLLDGYRALLMDNAKERGQEKYIDENGVKHSKYMTLGFLSKPPSKKFDIKLP